MAMSMKVTSAKIATTFERWEVSSDLGNVTLLMPTPVGAEWIFIKTLPFEDSFEGILEGSRHCNVTVL
jgi:hypothetical protein